MGAKVLRGLPLADIYLCTLDQIPGPKGSKGFSVTRDGAVVEMFVVREGDRVYAYQNSCPHTGAPLEWQTDRFLDSTGSFIQCSLHGAQFNLDNGYCVMGPCAGRSLEPLPLRLHEGKIYWVD